MRFTPFMPGILWSLMVLIQPLHAATNQFNVAAVSSLNYTINGSPDPALALVRGFSYAFNVSVSAIHPFYIKTASGVVGSGSTWNGGVSAQGVTSGTITFDVPTNAPDILYYQCGTHAAMTGPLNITDPPVVGITRIETGSDILLESTGTDVLDIRIYSTENLTNSAWAPAAIISNTYDGGTNRTRILLPDGTARFYQVSQGFFPPDTEP